MEVSRPASPWNAPGHRQRQREVKRDAVILAAARAFRNQGYHNTSLDDIAARLNVTKPTLYYYVANKEEMLFECFREGLDRIASALRTPVPGTGASARLTEVVRRYAQAVTGDFGWCLVRAETQDLSPAMSERIRHLKSEIDQGIRALIREGIADGTMRDCDPKMTAFALAGALNWMAHWYRDNDSFSAEAIADHFVELFEHGFAKPGTRP